MNYQPLFRVLKSFNLVRYYIFCFVVINTINLFVISETNIEA